MAQPAGPATVRHEVLAFRIVELQQVAEKLGLRKTGRKGELQGRILSYFGELDPNSSAAVALGRTTVPAPQQQWKVEQAAKVVHDVYRRMVGLPPLAATPPSDQSAHSSLVLPRGGDAYRQTAATAAVTVAGQRQQQHTQPPHAQQHQHQQHAVPGGIPGSLGTHGGSGAGGSYHPVPRAVRCICNVPGERGRMVQCTGRSCGVWQHCDCLGLDLAEVRPERFLCELCRARLADPFWEATEQVLPPSRLKPMPGRPSVITTSGVQEVQGADRVFYLNAQQLDPLMKDPHNNRVQAGCLLVGDEVAQRYHWPKHVDLKVNSMPHRPYGRASNAKMGINQRDDVASIGMMVVRGRNVLSLSAADGGTWVLTLQLARRRSWAQVKALMAPPESLAAAVARVRRQVSGSDAAGDGSDDDLLVSHQVVSLKDPMSGQRMQVPARFTDASGLQAFDLDSLLSMAERNRKWQDPTTMVNSSIEQLQVDTFMQRVLACLTKAPSVNDVEISAEGQWRPADATCDWFDISADPADVAAALAAALGRATPSAAAGCSRGGSAAAAAGVKTEPGLGDGKDGGGGSVGGAAAEEELVVRDSEAESEEEDEAEELRQAAAAVRRTSSAALEALAGQKRKPEPEVIDLCSDEDEAPPPAQRPHLNPFLFLSGQRPPPAVAPPQAAAAACQPLRIRLPIRRPQQQAAAAVVGGSPAGRLSPAAAAAMQQQALAFQPPYYGAWAGAPLPPAPCPPAVAAASAPVPGMLPYNPAALAAGAAAGGTVPAPAYPGTIYPPGNGFMTAGQMMAGGTLPGALSQVQVEELQQAPSPRQLQTLQSLLLKAQVQAQMAERHLAAFQRQPDTIPQAQQLLAARQKLERHQQEVAALEQQLVLQQAKRRVQQSQQIAQQAAQQARMQQPAQEAERMQRLVAQQQEVEQQQMQQEVEQMLAAQQQADLVPQQGQLAQQSDLDLFGENTDRLLASLFDDT